ncbi:DUF6398 domain-containing protein [Terrisporobacter sp.]
MSTDKKVLKEINDAIEWHCQSNFTKGYHKSVKALVNKLKKNKEFSMDSGKYLGWVAGLLYVVGEDSGLFEPNNVMNDKLYYSKTELAEGVGVSVTTMKARATNIREALPEISKFEADITYIYDEGFEESFGKVVDSVDFPDIEKYRIYMEKAMRSQSYEDTVKYLEKAIEEAKKKINPELLNNLDGTLYLEQEARPYLQLKNDLAYVHLAEQQYAKAIKEYKEILKLDKFDNQGIRFDLANVLLLTRRLDEFEELVKEFDEDLNTFMTYAKALYYFIKKDEVNAKRFIKIAFESNIYVPRYLLDMEMIEVPIPDKYMPGDKVEAMHYYELASETWLYAERSLYWLVDEFFEYVSRSDVEVEFSKQDVLKEVDAIYEMINNR